MISRLRPNIRQHHQLPPGNIIALLKSVRDPRMIQRNVCYDSKVHDGIEVNYTVGTQLGKIFLELQISTKATKIYWQVYLC